MHDELYIISGTNRGIGKSLLERALELGKTVWSLNRTLGEIKHPNHREIKIDLSDLQSVIEVLKTGVRKQALSSFKRIVCIVNAGTLHPMNQVGNWSPGHFAQAISTNFTSSAILANHLLSERPDNTTLLLSYVTSGAARNSYPGWSMYGSSKAALHHFFQTIQVENEKQPFVQVLGLNPGKTETAMQEEIRNTHQDDFPLADYFRQAYENGVLHNAQQVATFFIETLESDQVKSGEVISYSKQSNRQV